MTKSIAAPRVNAVLRERLRRIAAAMILAAAAIMALPLSVGAQTVARAVLFSAPGCPHCRVVREQVLPPLTERYGGRLQIVVIDTSTRSGLDVYWTAFRRLGVRQRGVPMLVVGDCALVGSVEIPQKLPVLIEKHIAEGGISWPDIPGLSEFLPAARYVNDSPTLVPPTTPSASLATALPVKAPTTAQTAQRYAVGGATRSSMKSSRRGVSSNRRHQSAGERVSRKGSAASPQDNAIPERATDSKAVPGMRSDGSGASSSALLSRVARDPVGNALSILVLIWMSLIVARAPSAFRRTAGSSPRNHTREELIPVLAILGLCVAVYLAQAEVRGAEAVCGPVGDCHTVHQSEYARLFGIFPIGIFGVLGYLAVLGAWFVHAFLAQRWAAVAGLALFGMTALGTLFSIYLTFLEPFVIGATCIWCLASAVIMTMLFCLSGPAGRRALRQLKHGPLTGLAAGRAQAIGPDHA